MSRIAALGVVFLLSSLLIAQNSDVASMESKLQRLQNNAATTPVDTSPTNFSEGEINAYFAAGKVDLPDGLQSVRFQGQPGVITANARVNFDVIKAGRSSLNPLLSIFTGVHDIVLVAHAQGGGHEGVVHVDSLALDGVEIPRFVLQSFIEKYVQPKYPAIGLDSRFSLPQKLDTATVGEHRLRVTQK